MTIRAARIRPAWTGGLLLGLCFAAPAAAVETQLWASDSPADYAKAEARGVVVQPDGVLTLGPTTTRTPIDSLGVVWSMVALEDGSVAIAGDEGSILKWSEGSGLRIWARLPVGQVFSLLADGDGVIAGTGPEGLIYRVGARGDTSLIARTGERYVWGLAPAGSRAWYAATGTRGRLLRVEPGKTQILLDTEESNLVSLVSDGNGGAYSGGDSRGRVYHLRSGGRSRTLFDAGEDEVRALARGPDGSVYAAILSATAVATEPEEEGRSEPQPVRSAVTGARAAVYRIVPDSSVSAVWTSPQPFVFAMAEIPRGLGAGTVGVALATGNRAAVYALSPPASAQLWLAAPEGQITALMSDGNRLWAATSNPASLWRLGPGKAERGELLSPVHDARRYARFGRIRWRGQAAGGRIELSTRSGNTDPPDTTWTEWVRSGDQQDGGRIASPAGRHLQWKLGMTGGESRVEAVEVGWREQNLAPRGEELVVAPQGVGFREGELQPRSEPVTQTLPGGQKVEYSISTSGARHLRELPAWVQGVRTVQWRGSDPNGDPLRYGIHVRPEPGDDWVTIGKDLQSSAFTWDTHSLSDGRYRLRVTANDAPENPLGEELTAEALSEPFTVDNTPPEVTALEARGEPGAIVVSGRASDAFSILTRLEVATDDVEGRLLSPQDGLADHRQLDFRARIDELEPGEHSVAVRAVDQAGNSALRAVRVKVPARAR